jgi:putative DNA primase/helicase
LRRNTHPIISPVFPVCAIVDGQPLCGGGPKCKSGKHPLTNHGCKDATTSESTIDLWNSKSPFANIGVATGANSNLLVLDIDPKNGGDETIAELGAQYGKLPHTPTVITGSGGRHYYFQHPLQPIKNKTGLFPGIDIKTDGGYVVAPPSLHVSGNHYEWLVTLDEAPLAPVPDWLLQALVTPKIPESPIPTNGGCAVFPEGQRNAELTRIAGRLRRQGLGMEALSAALEALNNEKCSPPLPQAEVMQIAKSISSKECPEFAALVPPTDSGNAELFATMFSDSVRYDHQRDLWLLWNEHWWRPDEERQVLLLAKDVARERQRCLDGHSSKEARKFALTSESKARLEATLALAQAEQPISDAGKNWDTDPWLLGVPNGVIDLHTGDLRDGKPADRITRCTNVPFDPKATCPRWEKFLNEIFNGDSDLIKFIHRAVGYSLTGSIAEQVMFVCYGTGANGKSVFFTVLRDVLAAYAYKAPSLLFDLDKRSSIPNDVASLDGKRFVIMTEMGESAYLNEARIKELVHGDEITARFLNKEFFSFMPVAKYWLAVNHKPKVRDESEGFWRSVCVIPFTQQFSGDNADKSLPEKLKEEAAGILAWAVRGCLEYQKHGLKPPPQVDAATKEYREESDILGEFILEKCVLLPDVTVPAGDLYTCYKKWTEEHSMGPKEIFSSTRFGRLMKRRFKHQRLAKGVTYCGIGLLSDAVSYDYKNAMNDPSVLKALISKAQVMDAAQM